MSIGNNRSGRHKYIPNYMVEDIEKEIERLRQEFERQIQASKRPGRKRTRDF